MIAPGAARRLWEALEPIHSSVYFAPEPQEALTAVGLRGFWMTYFASRSAAMGRVSAPVVEATFANFHPDMIGRAIPDAWALADPGDVLAARLTGATEALGRLLGGAPSSEDAELLGDRLLDSLAQADPLGRPLFSAHVALPRPTDPVGLVWHAATVFREHRGDGHVAALTAEGVSGVAAHVLAVGRGVTDRATQQGARRWSDDEWDTAAEGLRARRLVDPSGKLTDHGRDLVLRIETITDRRSAEALEPYEADLPAALEAAEALARTVLAAGAVPFPNPMGYARPTWAA